MTDGPEVATVPNGMPTGRYSSEPLEKGRGKDPESETGTIRAALSSGTDVK